MDIYLVGGAVRDELLGRPVVERDWVVVGSTPEEMRALGYRQVGRDFPVFLHPQSREEYALARTERKSGPGHTGFVCHAGPEVTLEEDLLRRDLTVNAMARAADGRLIDPFGGAADLEARLLRHVSDAFVEDPLRVFRIARFAAQLPGFQVAAETCALITRMAREQQLDELSAERVWQELHKALGGRAPTRFFEVLSSAGALEPWLAELAGIDWTLPAALVDPQARFGALAWQLDVVAVGRLCARLRAPGRFEQLADQVARHGRTLAGWRAAPADEVLQALTAVGAFQPQRDPEPALRVIEVCAGTALDDLRGVIERLRAVTAERFQREGVAGKALGEAIQAGRRAQLAAAQTAGPSGSA